MKTVYSAEPISIIDGIPIYSLSDRYIENYEKISSDHLRVYERERRNPFIDEVHWIECEESTAELVRKYSKDDDMILDVGVGMGRLLSRYPNLKRYGMDISLGYLKHAKAIGIDVCYSKIEDMPYFNDLFDMVTCTDVLEHVFDLYLCFSKIISIIKPGGILIIRVPYREALDVYLNQNCPYEFIHLRNFDEFGLMLFIEKIFSLIIIEYSFIGYRSGKIRFGASIPKFSSAIRKTLNYIEQKNVVFRGIISIMRKKIFFPVEMNMVVKKPIKY